MKYWVNIRVYVDADNEDEAVEKASKYVDDYNDLDIGVEATATIAQEEI